MMKERRAERSAPYPTAFIVLRSQSGLTLEDGCYALETLFAWHGFKVVPVGADGLKLVPLSEK